MTGRHRTRFFASGGGTIRLSSGAAVIGNGKNGRINAE